MQSKATMVIFILHGGLLLFGAGIGSVSPAASELEDVNSAKSHG